MNYVISFFTFTLILILSFFVTGGLETELLGAGIIGLVTTFIGFCYYAAKNWNRLSLICHCHLLALRKEHVRFSMSYQFLIKVEDKYLLVKNSNWDFYQHVGGKYKRLPSSQAVLDQFEAKDDLKMKNTGRKKDDFAVFVPAKNAIKFLDWFDTRKQREISHSREFYEELIEGKGSILSQEDFPYVDYEYKSTIRTPLRKSPNLKCWEIIQFDILELIPNDLQKKKLLALLQKGDTDYIKWADNELIQNDGHNVHQKETIYRIGEHTKWMVNQEWSEN